MSQETERNEWLKLEILKIVYSPEFVKSAGKVVKEDNLTGMAKRLY